MRLYSRSILILHRTKFMNQDYQFQTTKERPRMKRMTRKPSRKQPTRQYGKKICRYQSR